MKPTFHSIQLALIFMFAFSFTSCQKPEIASSVLSADTVQIAQIVYTADLHYGLKRAFRGNVVSSSGVNEAMVAQMNTLPKAVFPTDGGVNAGRTISLSTT